jgi:predicted transcriptional regulator of viral defense system
VFRHEEFRAAHGKAQGRSAQSSAAVLRQHVAAGNLLRVRRGVYATVPRELSPEKVRVDPYLLATRLAPDSVVAYHAALQFHGKAHSLWNRYFYFVRKRLAPFRFRGGEYVAVQAPAAVRRLPDYGGGITLVNRLGLEVAVTTHERTLVDVLHAPRYGGDWEEIWRSLEAVEFFDLDAVAEYALRMGSALTVARVGFYLEQHREPLMVEEHHLAALLQRAPAQPRYLDRRREPGRLQKRWNLIVPTAVLERSWMEPT